MSSSPEPCDWTEVNELARMTKNGTPEEQNIAFKKLIPRIKVIARRAVRNFSISSCFDSESFVEESPQIIFEKLQYYNPERKFVPWAAKVLRNAALDQIRKFAPELRESDLQPYRSVREEDSDEPQISIIELYPASKSKWSPYGLNEVDRALDANTLLCQGDLACLESELTALARVTVFIVLGVHHRVPAATWTQWLAAAGFPANFQPPTFAPEDDLSERIKIVASCLGKECGSIRMRWQRALPTLRKMKFLKDLR